MNRIAILDYGLGNVRSVFNAFRKIGVEAVISSDRSEIAGSRGMVIPGVGAFPQAMKNLQAQGLIREIENYAGSGRPILGICLGMQILFSIGEEFEVVAGLGLIPGRVRKIPIDPSRGRLPHISWSVVAPRLTSEETVFKNIQSDRMKFYFVHSFAATDVPPDVVVGVTDYLGVEVIAAVKRENVWGTQFHPEKSGQSGLQLLKNFAEACC